MESKVKSGTFFGPLNFPNENKQTPASSQTPSAICNECPCLMCESSFILPLEEQVMLTHFFTQHRLIIGDVHLIADLITYVKYWKDGFKGYDLEEYCTMMMLDKTPDGKYSPNEKYYLLNEVLPKDSELRMKLKQDKLEKVLTQHQMERTSTDFRRECLFCRTILEGLRSDFLKHLYEKHNLFLGKPNNLVYVEDMLNLIQDKMERFECIYCNKVFKDRNMLKEHMRKKSHKRVNPDNKNFDKFYLINYTESIYKNRKRTQNYFQKSKDDISHRVNVNNEELPNSNSDNSDWSDWEGDSPDINCLFCSYSNIEYNSILDHMQIHHNVNFPQITENLNFYERVKVVNYVRRQMHTLQCVTCNEKFENNDLLLTHLKNNDHFGIGSKDSWDQPEFFFPTYEDDCFLCFLESESNGWNDNDIYESNLLSKQPENPIMIL